jgi:hypothetical protein
MERGSGKIGTGVDEPRGLRIVTFNVIAPAYRIVADWAEAHGHNLVLLVTLPGSLDER